jgi:flavin-dependent dehydrogenase
MTTSLVAPRTKAFDVVVVGARCSGAATAMLLARAGLSVLAIDRAAYGTDTLSTHALTLPGVLQLSRWGVLDQVRAAGTPRVSRVIYDYDGEVVDIAMRARGDVDRLYAPRRSVLDRILVDAAVQAGAEVRHRVRLVELLSSADRVTGIVVDDGHRRLPIRARLVVGADGARSSVARQVGARYTYTAPHSAATTYAYAHALPQDAYRNYFKSGVGVGVIPTNNGEANVWVAVSADRENIGWPRSRQMFESVLREVVPELAPTVLATTKNARRSTFTGAKGFARTCWGPGWALVGDAGYFKDPISAHGMTDALIGAELLSRSVIAVFQGETEARALESYANSRQQLIAPMIPAIEHAATMAWTADSLKRAHLQMNAAMRAEWDYLSALQPLASGVQALT